MKTATLSLVPLLALALASTAAAPLPGLPLMTAGLPDDRFLIIIGAIVLIAGGALGGLVNFLKVLEHYRAKRAGELAGNNSGLVSRQTLDEELNRVYQRIEERDKRLEDKIDKLATTSATLATNVATVINSIGWLKEQVSDKGKGGTGRG